MARPLTASNLVGREAQIELLASLAAEAAAGQGRLALLAGEAGVGKSRLAREARALAEARGFRAVQIDCVEADQSDPFAPLLNLFDDLAGDPPTAAVLGPAGVALAQWVPGLAGAAPPLAPASPEGERRRLFQALTAAFARLAEAGPLLVLVEDLHWSDDATLDYLLHLAPRLATHPILLLLTYRSDQTQPGLSRFLSALDHKRLGTELPLPRLALSHVERLLDALLEGPRPLPRELAPRLYELTDGNPLLVEELLAALRQSGALHLHDGRWLLRSDGAVPIPRTVNDAVQRRAAGLGPAARQALTLAAVAGRRFDAALLEALTGLDETELIGVLRELIGSQLIVEEPGGRLMFRHALMGDAIYAGLLGRERQALHRRMAETLEQMAEAGPESASTDLGRHFYYAGDWRKALDYSRRSGAAAMRLAASHEAVIHFARAIEAAERLPGGGVPSALFRDRGQANELAGRFDAALADYERELQAARQAADWRAEWQSLIDLGFLWTSRDYSRSGDYLRRALALARELGDQALLAQSLNRLGNWHFNTGDSPAGLGLHEEALDIFTGLNDRPGMAATADLLGMLHTGQGDMARSVAYFERAADLYRDLDDKPGLITALATLSLRGGSIITDLCLNAPSSLPETDALAAEALRLATASDWPAGQAYALNEYGFALIARGHYGRALENYRQGLALATEIEHLQWQMYAQIGLGAIYVELLAAAEAQPHLERAMTLADQNGAVLGLKIAGAYLARGWILAGQFDRAAEVASRIVNAAGPPHDIAERIAWCASAEVALAHDEAQRALDLADVLLASAPAYQPGDVIPRLWLLRGEALLALRRYAEAGPLLAEGAATARGLGARPLLWRLHVAAGKAHRLRRQRDLAEAEFAAARAVIAELAAEIPDAGVQANFVRRAEAAIPTLAQPTRLRAARQASGGLTGRERQVATLIAQGKSNREIAQQLVIGERTVETYVANILNKLALHSRTQVAVWAADKHLVP